MKTRKYATFMVASFAVFLSGMTAAYASMPTLETLSPKLEFSQLVDYVMPDLGESFDNVEMFETLPKGSLPEQVYGSLIFLAIKTSGFGLCPESAPLAEGDQEGIWLPEWAERVVTAFRPRRQRVRLSSRFGKRFHPVLKRWRLHNGIDIAAPTGTPVLAVSGGIVLHAARAGASGNLVKIDHGAGWVSSYAHLNIIRPDLKPGTVLEPGEVIGEVGTTGRSTGPHLHFVIKSEGRAINPLTLEPGEFDYVSPVSSATRILNYYKLIRPVFTAAAAQLDLKLTE